MPIDRYPNPAEFTIAQTAEALAALDPWHVIGAAGEPAFQNGYRIYSGAQTDNSTPAFRKIAGMVYVKGLIDRVAAVVVNESFFILPVGYRPQYNYHRVQASNNTAFVMRINGHLFAPAPHARAGSLEISGGPASNLWIDISCSFPAEA